MNYLANMWFNAQFERTLGHTSVGGADLGECFSLIKELNKDDFQIWFQAWYGLGTTLESQAQSYASSGDHYSAYCAYLRASNYFRSSFFFLDENPSDSRIEKAYDQSSQAFTNALMNSDIAYQSLMIPFEDFFLPGYLFFPNHSEECWPLIIDTGGGDATKEELFLTTVIGALQRGYACLIFDGPGQGAMLRKQGIPFRPDWEVVMTAVIDHAIMNKKVDAKRIIVYGSSFGGYLAPRTATKEHRITACIANPGILNTTSAQLNSLPLSIQQAMTAGDDATVNAFFKDLCQQDPMKGFLFESRKIRFGAKTIAEMFKKTRQYEIENTVKNIVCPMLILDNESEHITKGQAKKLFDAIAHDNKQYHLFKTIDGHGGHCQPLSHFHTNEIIFLYLNTMLSKL